MRRVRAALTARPWVTAAAVVVAVGGSVTGYLLTGDTGTVHAQAGTTSRLVAATTGTVKEAVSTTGTITPGDEQDVSFSSSAQITSVRVAVGDKVTKGDVLGTIDTVRLKADRAQAEATLADAEATLAAAQDDSGSTAAQLAADQASVDTARDSVTAAKTALTEATLRAPISGTVAAVDVAKGDVSSGSSGSGSSSGSSAADGSGGGGGGGQIGSGVTARTAGGTGSSSGSSASSASSSSADFVLLGGKKWQVSAALDDTEVGLITKGDQAQILTSNATSTVFGVVASVSVLSSSSAGSASYPVVVDVTGSPTGLHDGAAATVSLIYKQLSNVLTVPTPAVHSSNGSSYVYVSSGGTKVKRTVTTGLASGGTTQITSGLSAGQQVYLDVLAPRRAGGATNRPGTQQRTGGRFPGGGQFPAGGFPGGFGGGR